MKLYKYWKIFLGIGIFFALSVLCGAIPNIIFAILFIYLGITQRKKAYSNPEYAEEMNQRKQQKQQKLEEAAHRKQQKAQEAEQRKQQKALERMPHQQKYKDLEQIHTKIVGVTFKNDDGSSRQDYLASVKNNEQLFLEEYFYKGNPAFRVCRKNGKCLGNLSETVAKKIKKKYNQNEKLVFVEEINCFDKNEVVYDDYDDDRKEREENYIYYCKIAIYFQ